MPAASQDIRGAVQYLKKTSGKAGVTGFCMGGALTVLSSVTAPEADAAVVWYGVPPLDYVDATKIHMPVQGPLAGTVRLLRADLVRGRAYAELCDDVRGWEPSKEVLWTWEPAERSDAPLNASPRCAWSIASL